MVKRSDVPWRIVMGMCLICLTGCGSGSAENRTDTAAISDTDQTESSMAEAKSDTAMPPEESQDKTEGEAEQEEPEQKVPEQEETGSEAANTGIQLLDEKVEAIKEVPQLPETGGKLEDFVPEGWELLDSAELDFNEDQTPDYVGVLDAVLIDEEGQRVHPDAPRILFAIAGDGTGGYRLDFQDVNLIRARNEGGVFGDPYMPLTADGNSFTTHTYGGSAWRWAEDYTYTCRDGIWWLTSSEEFSGYGDYITGYSKNDWESGVGTRKKNSSEFDDMEKKYEQEGYDVESPEYDLIYEVALDEPLTLEQASKRWWLAPDRVTDWEVEKIVFAADVELAEDQVELPGKDTLFYYCDENCALYRFFHDRNTEENASSYLAMYRWQDKVLSVLAKDDGTIVDPLIYHGKIYYSTGIVEDVVHRTMEEGKEQITEEEDTVGVRLNRMESDGTGKETVFEYRYPEAEQAAMGNKIPYLGLIYEINADEITVEVYIGGEPHPFYRMQTDGSGQERIGQIPKE